MHNVPRKVTASHALSNAESTLLELTNLREAPRASRQQFPPGCFPAIWFLFPVRGLHGFRVYLPEKRIRKQQFSLFGLVGAWSCGRPRNSTDTKLRKSAAPRKGFWGLIGFLGFSGLALTTSGLSLSLCRASLKGCAMQVARARNGRLRALDFWACSA